jgi:hypothetical protein
MTTAGLAEEKFLKLFEIYYRVFIKSELSDSELRIHLIKSIGYFKAKISNFCNISDFKRISGGDINSIKDAGEELINLIKSADEYENIRLSFNKYNEKVLKSLVKAAGINENLKASIEQKIYTGLNKLNSNFNLAADPGAVIQAFIIYYAGVTTEIKSLLKNMYKEESDTLAEMMVMLYINF